MHMTFENIRIGLACTARAVLGNTSLRFFIQTELKNQGLVFTGTARTPS